MFYRRFMIILFLISTCSLYSYDYLDDNDIKSILSSYPDVVGFKKEYLSFFSNDSIREKEFTEKNNGKYQITGDFNQDGVIDVCFTGLLSEKPLNGKYNCFVCIVKYNDELEIQYFKKLFKPVGLTGTIQNMVLYINDIGNLTIGFDYETGFIAEIKYSDNNFAIDVKY